MFKDWQYKVESISIWFQGGVKKWILIAAGICVVLTVPLYFLFTFGSSAWYNSPLNPGRFNSQVTFKPKNIPEKKMDFGPTQAVQLKDNTTELYMVVSNKENTQIGYNPFVYDIQVLDSKNNEINRETRSTFILPGDIRYITYRSQNMNAKKLNITRNNQTQKIFYNSNSINQKPDVEITNSAFKIRTFTDILYVSFSIKNKEKFNLKAIDILYTIRDARESVIGIGEYQLTDLAANEQRDLDQIEYTQPMVSEPVGIDIIWSVNYLQNIS